MEKFSSFYQQGQFSYSFEIFPPKTDQGIENLFKELSELKTMNPSYISVTYGAMGSTQELTHDLVIRIHKELNLNTAFHFTCVGGTQDSVKNYVEELKKHGINLIVALRGDPPQGSSSFIPPENGFSYANELVSYLHEIGGFSMAVAGYPEGHIESDNLEEDLKNLKRKVDAGADIVITQLFYDNKVYYNFVKRAREIGIQVPIIAGIMPILNVKQVERITSLCGASLPEDLHQELLAVENDSEAMKQIGIDHAIRQCQDLKANGVPGIHFYTLNKAYSTIKVLEAL